MTLLMLISNVFRELIQSLVNNFFQQLSYIPSCVGSSYCTDIILNLHHLSQVGAHDSEMNLNS